MPPCSPLSGWESADGGRKERRGRLLLIAQCSDPYSCGKVFCFYRDALHFLLQLLIACEDADQIYEGTVFTVFVRGKAVSCSSLP